jgi:ribosome-associated toxin RatA of RatAB toxin-antitoxin module
MKDITYTLDHVEDREAKVVSWTLVESEFLKSNSGRWELEDMGNGKVGVHYEVDVEFKFPVPSLILNRVIKGTLPAMIKSFETQAKKLKK